MSILGNILGGILCVGSSVCAAWLIGGERFGWIGIILLAIAAMFFWVFMLMQTVVEGLVGLVIMGGMLFALKFSLHTFGEGAARAAKKTGEVAGAGALDTSHQITYWLLALLLSFFLSRLCLLVFKNPKSATAR